MFKVNSSVKLNMPQIEKLTQAAVTALELTAEALHEEVVQAQVVPRMDGALQGESFSVDYSECKNGKITFNHSEPYARRLYYHPEYNFQKGPWKETIHHKDGSVSHLTHEGNPNAKGNWYEDWEAGGSKADFAPKAFKQFYKDVTGI